MHIETSGFKNNPVTEHESNDSDRKKKPATFYNKKKTSRVALFARQRENMVIQTSILTVDAKHEITHDKPKNRFEFFYDRWKILFRRAKLWNALAKLQERKHFLKLKITRINEIHRSILSFFLIISYRNWIQRALRNGKTQPIPLFLGFLSLY